MSLPRGLLSRDGSPVKTNARLPSLRGDSLSTRSLVSSSPSLASASSSRLMNHLNLPSSSSSKNKTRGGAQKRQFKPTVPTSTDVVKNSQGLSSSSSQELLPTTPTKKSKKNEGRQTRSNANDKFRGQQQRNNNKDDKKFVQLESSVFTGYATSSQTSFKRTISPGQASSYSSSSKTTNKSKATTLRKKKTEDYMRDDFVVDSSEGSESDGEDRKRSRRFKVKPIGWDTLFEGNEEVKDVKPVSSDSECLTSALLREGKLLLIQLPDQLIPRMTNEKDDDATNKLTLEAIQEKNGFLGRLRVYESGAVDFVYEEDQEQGFDLIRSEEDILNLISIKQEDGTEIKVPVASQTTSSFVRHRQEIISLDFSEEEAVSMGRVDHLEKLILIPQIDNKHS